MKLRRVKLPDGTEKIEVVPESPEEKEKRERLRKEHQQEKYQKYKNKEELYKINTASKRGFNTWNKYRQSLRYESGKQQPMSENKYSPSYLGVYIAENILPDIFENPEMMPYGNPGFDAVCKRGNKIDVKSACLRAIFDKRCNCTYYVYDFVINKNKIADYFLMIGFDNRDNLNPLHVWLINSNEIIHSRNGIEKKLNEFDSFTISKRRLDKFKKYELSDDKLLKVKELCMTFKETNF